MSLQQSRTQIKTKQTIRQAWQLVAAVLALLMTCASVTELARYDGFDQDERGIARDEIGPIAWFTDPARNVFAVLTRS